MCGCAERLRPGRWIRRVPSHDGRAGRERGQEAARTAPAEDRLAGAPAEGRADVGPLALLEQDDGDQGQADDHVDDGDEDAQRAVSSGGTSKRMIA